MPPRAAQVPSDQVGERRDKSGRKKNCSLPFIFTPKGRSLWGWTVTQCFLTCTLKGHRPVTYCSLPVPLPSGEAEPFLHLPPTLHLRTHPCPCLPLPPWLRSLRLNFPKSRTGKEPKEVCSVSPDELKFCSALFWIMPSEQRCLEVTEYTH